MYCRKHYSDMASGQNCEFQSFFARSPSFQKKPGYKENKQCRRLSQKIFKSHVRILESLSKRIFEMQTATGREHFAG